MKRTTLFLILVTVSLSLQAYDFAVQSGTNTIYFNITDNVNKYVEVTHQNISSPYYTNYPTGVVIIPNIVSYNETNYYVTTIGTSAFSGCNAITTVFLPNTVTSIGLDAFYNCTNLTKVNFPNLLNSISDHTFDNCTLLDSVYLPNTLKTIGNYAFKKCSSLSSISIPDSVTTLGYYVFEKCSDLSSVTFPNMLTTINNYTFSECTSLSSLTFPNSLLTIGEYAFDKCSGLTSINFSNSLTSLGYSSFANCSTLTSINLPNSLEFLGANAFNNCTNLNSVTLSNSLNYIGSYAFGHTNLQSISFPSSLDSLGWSVFAGCSNLDTIISNPINPPKISNNTFSLLYNTLLLVPCGYNSVYHSANYWSNFTNLRGVNDYTIVHFDTICKGETYNQFGFNFLADTSGIYTQNLIRFDGCDSTIRLNLYVVPELENPFNMTVTLKENGIEVEWLGYSQNYEVYRNDTLHAIVSQVYNLESTFLDTNVSNNIRYCYKVRAAMGGCFSEMTGVYCKTYVGIEDIEMQNEEVKIYPNPNNGRFVLSSESIIENTLVEVYNMDGRLVKSFKLIPSINEQSIDLSSLTKGAYTISLKNNKCKSTNKLIIQ